MSETSHLARHYRHGDLLRAIEAALVARGKSIDALGIDDLAPVDEFHVGGRVATEQLFASLELPPGARVLDIGCGLGGVARYLAERHAYRVTGIDLSAEYIETGRVICAWLGLDRLVTLQQGSASAMPFPPQSFDAACLLHVGMNIDDKAMLFGEVFRVLRRGAGFGIYDIMRVGPGEPRYPLPWAGQPGQNHLATPAGYREALRDAGFTVTAENDRREFALEFFARLRARSAAPGGPPPLGLHILMGEDHDSKLTNLVDGIERGSLAPVEILARKHAAPQPAASGRR